MAFALQNLELTAGEFADWQQLLEEKTGISFEKHRLILQTGLNQRMREIGCADYRSYFRRVQSGNSGALEWESLLRTLTIKETRFFRDPNAFDAVKSYLFDKLTEGETDAPIDIWSVACSTGEEAYSLAMIANDCIEGLSLNRRFGVTATDICISSLMQARQGCYSAQKTQHIEHSLLNRYFTTEKNGSYSVGSTLKARTCFVQTNIIEPTLYPQGMMDIIYCQNILIYFKPWRQQQVLNNLVKQLKPNGLLVLGSGEATGWQHANITRLQSKDANAFIKGGS
ncbi:MAG: protein-glutamate O-methyltransferase CheR [Cellvibrionales bacterium]|nr:protein-glutamate O-methyltransferase CheR [Cellvibrionales bacterium]